MKTLSIDKTQIQLTIRPSLSPHISQQEPEKGVSNSIIQGSAKHIRRLYEGSDIRVCEDCGRKGDRWEMEEHSCRI